MFSITRNGDKTSSKVKEYTLDNFDDVQRLPTQTKKGMQINPKDTISNEYCATGSSAFIISTAQLFMLNSEGIWCEV